MVKARDAARYIISLDKKREYFTKNLIILNTLEGIIGHGSFPLPEKVITNKEHR